MNDNIKEKLKFRIAISKMDSTEDEKTNKVTSIKKLGLVACTIISISGVAFAGNTIIEKIWKVPKPIENPAFEITEENKKFNISEEEAKEIAIKKLKKAGLNSDILGSDNYKADVESDKIMYRFETEDDYSISIDGFSGEFFEIWNNQTQSQNEDEKISKEEAKKVANKYLKQFDIDTTGYDITEIKSYDAKKNSEKDEEEGNYVSIKYLKKYDETYNPYEYICTEINAKDNKFEYIRTENEAFDNNEIKITKEEAIKIALMEDENVESNKIASVDATLEVVKMNTKAYERSLNKEEFYKPMQTVDYPDEARKYYLIDERIRNAWVVTIKYEDNYKDVVKRYTEGIWNYFVDATTGEIIGGATMYYSN